MDHKKTEWLYQEQGFSLHCQARKKANSSSPRSIVMACGLFALWLALLTGCSSIPQVPTEHILMFSGRGYPVDPTGNIGCADKPPCNGSHFWLTSYPEMGPDQYDAYLSDLFTDRKSVV